MKRGIDKAKDIILDFFDEITIPCIELKDLNRIALVSSNYDKNIADIVKRLKIVFPDSRVTTIKEDDVIAYIKVNWA